MPQFTFDTSAIVSKKIVNIPDNLFYSDVVLTELISVANDKNELKAHLNARRIFREDERLITPTVEDWDSTARILFLIEQESKKANKGKSLKKPVGATQRMAFDVLLATSARRYRVTVVT